MTQPRKPLFNRTYLWALAWFIPGIILLLDASRPQAPECATQQAICTLQDDDSAQHRLTLIWPTGLSPTTDNRQLAPALARALELQLATLQNSLPVDIQASGFDQIRLHLSVAANASGEQQLQQTLEALQQAWRQPLADAALAQLNAEQDARNYLNNQKPQQQLINNLYAGLEPANQPLTLQQAYLHVLQQKPALALSSPQPEFVKALAENIAARRTATVAPQDGPSVRIRQSGLMIIGQRLPGSAGLLQQSMLAQVVAQRLDHAGISYRIISQRQQPFGIRALLLNTADWTQARQQLAAELTEQELESARKKVAADYQAVFDSPQGRHQMLETKAFYPQGTPTQAGFHDTLNTFTTELLQPLLRQWLGLAE